MEKRIVNHQNLIGHEINESIEFYANDVFDREVYCRYRHKVAEPLEKDCRECPYYAGVAQGHGHECEWEDVVDENYIVEHKDRYKEYERVDRLIKLGIILSPERDFVAKVMNLEYDRTKWIYEQSADKRNRFLLGIRGERTLICCGVNPSTASPENLDLTMKKVEVFAKTNGYDSYLMINLYPMRATNPNDMDVEENMDIVEKNIEFIKSILSVGNCDIWAAWGNTIEKRKYLKKCLNKIVDVADKYNCNWYSIGGTTAEGHPYHPSRISYESKMQVFDVHKYICR